MTPHRLIIAWLTWPLVGSAMLSIFSCPRGAVGRAPSADEEAAYTRTITERSDKIVGTLDIADAAKAARVRDIIAAHYRGLREVHDARDAKINEAKQSPGADPTLAKAWTNVAQDQAKLKLIELHHRFLARLAVELSPEQIEKMKDGLTYGVVRVTYERYLELFPTLNDEQKREILAMLLEAREHAMDGGSSEEKHATFGKYKGRINNYISQQGFDLKAAEKELAGAAKRGRG